MTLELQRALISGFAVMMVAALALLVATPPTGVTLLVSIGLGVLTGAVTYVRERRS